MSTTASQPVIVAAIGGREVPVHLGPGTLSQVGPLLAAQALGDGALVVVDSGIASAGEQVAQSCRDAGLRVAVEPVPAGEASKTLGELERLSRAAARAGIRRRDAVVAVGGGVVGDLAGFLAASYQRGVRLVQVPTTLLAMVDSSLGGKTGVDLPEGKNYVGAVYQPEAVVMDTRVLGSLSARELSCGFAEVVKYGMILDAEFFAWLEANTAAIISREPAAIEHLVQRSAELKAFVVERDERELTGLRACLNYGHTFAHAFETATGYGTLLHGEAVSLGMVAAAQLAATLGRITAETVSRQHTLLERLGLPVTTDTLAAIADDTFLAIMGRDKKTVHGQLRFVLPDRIGHVELVEGIASAAVTAAIVGVRST